MSTQMIDRGTVAASTRRTEPAIGENPRTRRYGINPAISILIVHPRESGRQLENIPFGYPLKFETLNDMKVHNWSVDKDDKGPPDQTVDLTAKEAIDNVRILAWQSSRDMGFRELPSLTSLSDTEADDLLATLLPPLDSAACLYAEENTKDVTFERSANGQVETETVTMFRCLTCTLRWLESEECETLSPEYSIGWQLRRELLDAYKVNRRFFRQSWAEWMADMEKRRKNEPGLAVLNDDHLHVMYQLHEVNPDDKAANLVTQRNASQADALREGIREGVRDLAVELRQPTPEPFDREAERKKIKAELTTDPQFIAELASALKPPKEKSK